MAVSGKTPDFEIPYYLDGDAPPNMATVTKAMADRLEALHGAIDLSQLVVPGSSDGKLVIVKDGAAAFIAMKGDGTIDEEGNLQLGSKVVGTNELGDKAVSTAKVDDKAVTEAKLGDSAATTAKIKDGAVTEPKLSDGAVTSRKIKPTFIEGVLSEKRLIEGQNFTTSPVLKGTEKEILVPVDGILVVHGTADFLLDPTSADLMKCEVALVVDGAVQTKVIRCEFQGPASTPDRDLGGTYSQQWIVPVTAGARKLSMKSRNVGSYAGLGHLLPTNTNYTAMLVAI